MVGSFSGDVGIFEGPIRSKAGRLVRYTWSRVTTPSPRWSKRFPEDGKTWGPTG